MRYRPRQVCLCDPNRLLSSLPRFSAHCHARSLLPTVVNHSTIYDENPDLHHGLLGRDGSYSGDGSGDIFIAFTTANGGAIGAKEKHKITMLPNEQLDPIFLATVQATEEAVINAMVAAETMTGINDHKVIGLPHERLREVLRKYNRLVK